MKIKNLLKRSIFVLLILLNLPAWAQNKEIHGKITDSKTRDPLVGVSVTATGTSTGATTDANGIFRFSVPASATTITVTYIGYVKRDAPITVNGPVNIVLVESATNLNEVKVVSVGYGTQNKGEVTSAASHVDPEDFRQSGSRNPLDLIQGKVPGLNITRTDGGSNPNGGVSIQLRGAVTVTGSASPLIVIDSIPGGNLDLLQQDDIASIDVLKDGSGAAIYGTSANAGGNTDHH